MTLPFFLSAIHAAHKHDLYRVGPDSPFALLSPVLESEIPFEKGLWDSFTSGFLWPCFEPEKALFEKYFGPFALFLRPQISSPTLFIRKRTGSVEYQVGGMYRRRHRTPRTITSCMSVCPDMGRSRGVKKLKPWLRSQSQAICREPNAFFSV